MRMVPLAALLLAATAHAQFQIQQSNTTSGLRGIHALSSEIAWASGANGTILHTTDGGTTWLLCTTPPQAEKLDFRGIQAFDAQTAIVMSSGKGNLSRLYKTSDACKTWKLLVTNPDKEGFWDAIQFEAASTAKNVPKCDGAVLGDPVKNSFVLFLTADCGEHWERQVRQPIAALKNEAIFAASNSSLALGGPSDPGLQTFITGGPAGPRLITLTSNSNASSPQYSMMGSQPVMRTMRTWHWDALPSHKPTDSSGAFSLAHVHPSGDKHEQTVIVGGDFKLPNDPTDTVWLLDSHGKIALAQTQPHGYRSAVAYDPATKTWITVGPNGTDISTDDGKNWTPLKPTASDPPDADKNWNALSLPFVVGPNGRIGKLTPTPKSN